MFSIVDSLLLRSLPVRHAGRLALLWQDDGRSSWTNPIWEEIRNRPQLFDDAFAWSSTRFNLAASGPAEYIDGIWASGAMFTTLRAPALLGRDLATTPRVAIVNQAFVRRFLGNVNPLGRTLRADGGATEDSIPIEIVGVVSDAVYRSLRDSIPPTLYRPLAATNLLSSVSLSVRTAQGDPALLSRSLASALGSVHPDLSLSFRPLAVQVNASLTQERVVALLSAFFGGLALLLAALGLYGVRAYSVSRRRIEIGIRMALGTTPSGVIRLVLTRVARLVGVGVLIGVGVSWYASRFISSLLYGLAERDPLTVLGAAAVLVAVGALAGWLPARRAAGIDPATVLREG